MNSDDGSLEGRIVSGDNGSVRMGVRMRVRMTMRQRRSRAGVLMKVGSKVVSALVLVGACACAGARALI